MNSNDRVTPQGDLEPYKPQHNRNIFTIIKSGPPSMNEKGRQATLSYRRTTWLVYIPYFHELNMEINFININNFVGSYVALTKYSYYWIFPKLRSCILGT